MQATPTVRGFTAGGSGTVSTEAIASNSPRTQIMHELNFIPALHHVLMITEFRAPYFCEVARETFFSARRPVELANTSLAASRRSLGKAIFDDSGRGVGNPEGIRVTYTCGGGQ